MIRAGLNKLISTGGVILALALVVFVLQRLAPGDPARTLAGARATDEQVAAKRIELGLDRPLPEQFLVFLQSLATGNLGTSATTGNPVAQDIMTYAPATIELVGTSFLLALLVGFWLGMVSGARRRGSGAVRAVSVLAASFPSYVVGIVLLLTCGVWLGILPTDGRIDPGFGVSGPTGFVIVDSLLAGSMPATGSALLHLILPAIAVALVPAVAISRVLRTSLSRTLEDEYVLAARAKGLNQMAIVRRHALRNALGPVLSVAGLQLAAMVGNVVVVEQLFAWGGLGQYLVNSLALLDYSAVLGVVLTLGFTYVVLNLAVDAAQVAADPRLRAGPVYQKRGKDTGHAHV